MGGVSRAAGGVGGPVEVVVIVLAERSVIHLVSQNR